jgi:transposase
MEVALNVVGIDVSKATLAVCYGVQTRLQHAEVSNSKAGFEQLVRRCGTECLYVMEATGSYYLALAYHLVEQGAQVAVVNPLVVRRFLQMHLGKGKSNRKDAQWLLRYGQQQTPKPWQPDEAVLVECRQLEQVSEQLIRQKTMTLNSLEALPQHPVVSAQAEQHLRQALGRLEEQIQLLETELVGLLEQHPADALAVLHSRHWPQNGRHVAALRQRLYASRDVPAADGESGPLPP